MIVYKGYSFLGAFFAMTVDIATALSYAVTIITFGWLGRKWPLRLALFSFNHPYNVVYKDGVDAESDNDSDTEEQDDDSSKAQDGESGAFAGSMCSIDSNVTVPENVQSFADAIRQSGLPVYLGNVHWANGDSGVTCNIGEYVDTTHSLDGDREKVRGITTMPIMTFFFDGEGKFVELDLPHCHMEISSLIERNKTLREKYGHLNNGAAE